MDGYMQAFNKLKLLVEHYTGMEPYKAIVEVKLHPKAFNRIRDSIIFELIEANRFFEPNFGDGWDKHGNTLMIYGIKFTRGEV